MFKNTRFRELCSKIAIFQNLKKSEITPGYVDFWTNFFENFSEFQSPFPSFQIRDAVRVP